MSETARKWLSDKLLLNGWFKWYNQNGLFNRSANEKEMRNGFNEEANIFFCQDYAYCSINNCKALLQGSKNYGRQMLKIQILDFFFPIKQKISLKGGAFYTNEWCRLLQGDIADHEGDDEFMIMTQI